MLWKRNLASATAYKILVSPLARQDILETADYLQSVSDKPRAAQWKNALLKALSSLGGMPKRCPVADESSEVGIELRELHHRAHRIIFTVDDVAQVVQILRIYHSSRAPLRLEDLN